MRRSRCAVLVGTCGLAASLAVMGCNGGKKANTNPSDEPTSTGLARFQNARPVAQAEPKPEAVTARHDLASLARQSALDIESLRSQKSDLPRASSGPSNDDAAPQFAMTNASNDSGPSVGLRRAATSPRPTNAEAPALPVSRAAATERTVDTSAADREWAVAAGVPMTEATPAPGAPVEAPEFHRPNALAIAPAVAAWMRGANLAEHNPAAAGMLLASLETATPGALAELGDENSNLRRSLSVDDVQALLSARDHLFTPAQPAPASDLPLKLGSTLFCTRVESFGKYDAIRQDTFRAGVPLRVLVYTEVEKFSDRETSDGQRAVELSQSLALVQDATGSEVWSVPAQTISETSRRTRRDFYLVQQVELPQNLALGSYKLRVSVTDQNSKATDEAWIKFTITADGRSALAR